MNLLNILLRPLEAVFSTAPVSKLRATIPGMQAVLAPPIAVQCLARVAVASALGSIDLQTTGNVLKIEDIVRESR